MAQLIRWSHRGPTNEEKYLMKRRFFRKRTTIFGLAKGVFDYAKFIFQHLKNVKTDDIAISASHLSNKDYGHEVNKDD